MCSTPQPRKLTKLNARLDDLRVALGNLSLPVFIGGVEQLTGAIERSTKRVELYQKAFAQLNSDLNSIKAHHPELGNNGRGEHQQSLRPAAPCHSGSEDS